MPYQEIYDLRRARAPPEAMEAKCRWEADTLELTNMS